MVQTPKIDSAKVKDSAADVAAALVGAGSRAANGARDAAGQAKDWASPRVDAFVDWLRPRAEKAWNDSVLAAAPKVEGAAVKAGPLVDNAHEKIVDEYLPKLVAAFNAAAARAALTSEEVAEAAKKAAKAAEKSAKKAQRKGRRRKALAWTAVLGGTAAVGYAFYRRAQPQTDPWAEPWEQAAGPDLDSGPARDAKHVVGDAAEAVGEAAGAAVAKGKEATEKLSEKAAEVKDDVAARASRARRKSADAADSTAAAADDAADAVVDAAESTKDDSSK
jgi:colicin import membrane protein